MRNHSMISFWQIYWMIPLTIHASTGLAFEFENPYKTHPSTPSSPADTLTAVTAPATPSASSHSYVTPLENIIIPTPAPKSPVRAQENNSFDSIGEAATGYLIVYNDNQGIRRIGLLPFRNRMNSQTTDYSGGSLVIRRGINVEIQQGGVLLQKDIPYLLKGETKTHQKILFSCGIFTQEVSVAKDNMRPVTYMVSPTELENLKTLVTIDTTTDSVVAEIKEVEGKYLKVYLADTDNTTRIPISEITKVTRLPQQKLLDAEVDKARAEDSPEQIVRILEIALRKFKQAENQASAKELLFSTKDEMQRQREALKRDYDSINYAIAQSKETKTYQAAIDILETAIAAHPNAQNIDKAKEEIRANEVAIAEYKRNTARGLVRYNGNWMTPSEAKQAAEESEIESDWIRGQQSGSFSYSANVNRYNNSQRAISQSNRGGYGHYSSRREAAAAADSKSDYNVGQIDAARDAGGTTILNSSVGERFIPVSCDVHYNCWVIKPITRNNSNKGFYDAVDDTRGRW